MKCYNWNDPILDFKPAVHVGCEMIQNKETLTRVIKRLEGEREEEETEKAIESE